MIIQAFSCGPFATNAYVIACQKTKSAAVLDPSPGSLPLLFQYLQDNGLLIEKIILTHSHWDHIADAAALQKKCSVPVYVHPLDKGNLEFPGSDCLPLMQPIEAVFGALPLEENEVISLGEIELRVLHTPGHSPGGICLFCEKEGILFSGDTLFKGTMGSISLPTANATAMWNSLHKLSYLPAATKVYPGHGPSTKIGDETWLSQAERIFGDY